jgi:hypothetical protein
VFSEVGRLGVLGGSLEGGYRTLGWDAALTVWAEDPRSTFQAIHAPLIITTSAPNGTVSGVFEGPIVCPYIKLKYISTCAPA